MQFNNRRRRSINRRRKSRSRNRSNRSRGFVVPSRNNNFVEYRSKNDGYSADTSSPSDQENTQIETGSTDNSLQIVPAPQRVILQCQLAHGSPTGLITDLRNVKDLYGKIATCFDGVNKEDILYCTLNTHHVDMDAVLVSTLTTSDFIFAHLAGQRKEVELVKSDKMLGITLSDNGAGRVFIRRIAESSCLHNARNAVLSGDHIEKINGESMVGKRHLDVAAKLRAIAVGDRFTLRLVSPLTTGFSHIATRNSRKSAKHPQQANYTDGTQTIRFKNVGGAVIEEPTDSLVLQHLNEVFAEYLGIQDDELAMTTLDIASKEGCSSFEFFENQIRGSSLAVFDFPQEFLFDLWGTIDDYNHRRLVPNGKCNEE